MRLFLSLFLLLTTLTPCWGYKTENVIFVIIDGLRCNEGFEDPTYKYIPNMRSMMSEGTFYSKMFNTHITVTAAAVNAMLSGVPEIMGNAEVAINNLINKRCSFYPLITEELRRQKGLSQYRVLIAAGKADSLAEDGGTALYVLNHSHSHLDPYYKCTLVRGDYRNDIKTYELFKTNLELLKPQFAVLHLAAVDNAGHDGNYALYCAAITRADSIVGDLWKLIQARPPYTNTYWRDKTTLIITTDHGRHTDDFQNHGDSCHGCRHIFLLALGPDTPANQVVNKYVTHLDIAPTMAELLGIKMEYAWYHPLPEMIMGYEDKDVCLPTGTLEHPSMRRLTHTPGMTRSLFLTGTGEGVGGVLFVTYYEYNRNIRGWDMWCRSSNNEGDTWSDSMLVFRSAEDTVYELGSIAAISAETLTVATSVRIRGLGTWTWTIFAKNSFTGGQSWSEIYALTKAPTSIDMPLAIVNGREGFVCYWSHPTGKAIGQEVSVDTIFKAVTEGVNLIWKPPTSFMLNNRRPIKLRGLRFREMSVVLTWQDERQQHSGLNTWDVFVYNKGQTYNVSSTFEHSVFPSVISFDNTNMGVIWIEKPYPWHERTRLLFTVTTNNGSSWRRHREISHPLTTVRDGFLLHELDTKELAAIWVAYKGTKSNVYYRKSTNWGQSWDNIRQFTNTTGSVSGLWCKVISSRIPRLAWMDNRDGNWEIYFGKVTWE